MKSWVRVLICGIPTIFIFGCPSVSNPCTADSDCAGGQVCTNGVCGASPECQTDADCDAGETCTNGSCVANTGCQADADCADGEMCTDGECVAATGCQTDADCADGEMCTNGECVAATGCQTDADCADGETCTNGECVAQTGGGDATAGQAFFMANGCAVCHGANAQGVIGPSLVGVDAATIFSKLSGAVAHGGGVFPNATQQDADNLAAFFATLVP